MRYAADKRRASSADVLQAVGMINIIKGSRDMPRRSIKARERRLTMVV
jgi:hypothetical protein